MWHWHVFPFPQSVSYRGYTDPPLLPGQMLAHLSLWDSVWEVIWGKGEEAQVDWAPEGGAFRWKLASCQQQERGGGFIIKTPFCLLSRKRTLGRCLFKQSF